MENEEDSPPQLDPSVAPLLLFFDDDNGGAARDKSHACYVYSIPKRRGFQRKGFEIFIRNVNWVTPQGWVLTLENHDGSRDVSLRDPFSHRGVQLPPDREGFLDRDITKCILSTHQPTDQGCVVLVTHQKDPVLFYCRPGDSRWSRYEYQPELICENSLCAIQVMSSLTACGRKFYGQTIIEEGQETVVTLEFSPEPTFKVTRIAKMPSLARCDARRDCLVESCGELFMVQFYYRSPDFHRIMHVKVDRLDWSKCAWVKVAGLGVDRVFFVSIRQFGTSMTASALGLKPNCIYFTRHEDKGLYVYDMEQGTIVLHDPAPYFLDFFNTLILMPAQ